MVIDILLRTLGDLRDPRILMRLFIPLVAGIVLVSLLGYGLFGLVLTSDWLQQSPMMIELHQWLDSAQQSVQSIPIIGALLVWLISAVVTVTAGVLSVLIGSYLVLLFAMLVAGFMTESLVKVVHERHYAGLEYHGHGSMWGMIVKLALYGFGLLLLLIITLPILFVPLLNVVWFWWLGFLFFRYSMVLDVGSVILPEALFEREKPLTNWTPTLVLMVFYLLSMLPLMGLFAPMLAVIALAHYFFERLTAAQQGGM